MAALPEITEGTLKHGLPYYVLGEGEPLVVLRWFTPTHANPSGWELKTEANTIITLSSTFGLRSCGNFRHLHGSGRHGETVID